MICWFNSITIEGKYFSTQSQDRTFNAPLHDFKCWIIERRSKLRWIQNCKSLIWKSCPPISSGPGFDLITGTHSHQPAGSNGFKLQRGTTQMATTSTAYFTFSFWDWPSFWQISYFSKFTKTSEKYRSYISYLVSPKTFDCLNLQLTNWQNFSPNIN